MKERIISISRVSVLYLAICTACSPTEPSPHTGNWSGEWRPLLTSAYAPINMTVEESGRAEAYGSIMYKTSLTDTAWQSIDMDLRFYKDGTLKGTGEWCLSQNGIILRFQGPVEGNTSVFQPTGAKTLRGSLDIVMDGREYSITFYLGDESKNY